MSKYVVKAGMHMFAGRLVRVGEAVEMADEAFAKLDNGSMFFEKSTEPVKVDEKVKAVEVAGTPAILSPVGVLDAANAKADADAKAEADLKAKAEADAAKAKAAGGKRKGGRKPKAAAVAPAAASDATATV